MATTTNALFSLRASGKVGKLNYRQGAFNQTVWERRFSEGTGIEAGTNKEQTRFKQAANAWTRYLTNGLIRIAWFKYITFTNARLNPYARYMAAALAINPNQDKPSMASSFSWGYDGYYSWTLVNIKDGSSNVEHGFFEIYSGTDYTNLPLVGTVSAASNVVEFYLPPRPTTIYLIRIEHGGVPRSGNCRTFV